MKIGTDWIRAFGIQYTSSLASKESHGGTGEMVSNLRHAYNTEFIAESSEKLQELM